MEQKQDKHYFISWVRWQEQDGYALWINMPEKELFWADAHRRIPLFSTPDEVESLASGIGVQLRPERPVKQDLDECWRWLQQTHKQPSAACLAAWNVFSEVAASTADFFTGDHRVPLRNQVFDLLYAYYGPWHSAKPAWTLQQRKALRRILRPGFRLWQKYVYLVEQQSVLIPAQD